MELARKVTQDVKILGFNHILIGGAHDTGKSELLLIRTKIIFRPKK